MQTSTHSQYSNGRAIGGLVIAAVGFTALLSNLGLIELPPLHILWPLALIGLGLARVARGRIRL